MLHKLTISLILACLLSLVLTTGINASSKNTPKLNIVSLSVSPKGLRVAGAVVVTAKLTDAKTCQLKMLSHPGFLVLYSHAPQMICGKYKGRIVIKRTGHSARTITF